MLRLVSQYATIITGAGRMHGILSHSQLKVATYHKLKRACSHMHLMRQQQPSSKQSPSAKISQQKTHGRFKRVSLSLSALLCAALLSTHPAYALSLNSTRNVANSLPAANSAPAPAPAEHNAEIPAQKEPVEPSSDTALPEIQVEDAHSVFTQPRAIPLETLQPQTSAPAPAASGTDATSGAPALAASGGSAPAPEREQIDIPAEALAATKSSHVLRREQIQEKTTQCEAGRDMSACNDLGMHYLILAIDHGLDIELNMRLAAHNLEQACAGGVKSACGFWANALGMYGNYFVTELNPTPNYARGKMLLEQSCEQGDPFGCAQLGTLYLEGKGVEQNVTQGLQLFALSCKLALELPVEISQVDNNVGMGCFYLGRSYLHNQTLDPQGDVAISYLKQACDLHAAPACSTLADQYQQQGDFEKAHTFRERACYTGMTEECVNEAVFYHHVGNDAEANRLLKVGCDMSNDNACTLLSSNMLYGIGMEQDVQKALTLVRRSCEHDSPLACFYLAQLYHTGISNVPSYRLARNLNIAHDLYLKACNLGNDLACIELQKLDQILAPHVDTLNTTPAPQNNSARNANTSTINHTTTETKAP